VAPALLPVRSFKQLAAPCKSTASAVRKVLAPEGQGRLRRDKGKLATGKKPPVAAVF
jgi:hypothetical protein